MAKGFIPQPGKQIQLGEFLLGDHRHPAVYFLHDEEEIVYVGQSKTLKWRIEQHLSEGVKTFDAVSFTKCCVSRLLEIEGHYIRKLVPRYNRCSIAGVAREERGFVPDDPRIRTVNGEPVVGSLGLSRLMNCSRDFAKMLITMTGKPEITFGEALWCAAVIKEPKPEDPAETHRLAQKRASRFRNRKVA